MPLADRMRLLGYDFVTKETLRLLRPRDLCVDDVAVVRPTRRGAVASRLLGMLAPSADDDAARTKRSASDNRHSASASVEKRRMSDMKGNMLVQRCVVVAREEDGFGLTVSGDNPVFVQTVKEDGAAQRAGIRQGDRILKVNGIAVGASNHLQVVRMISDGQTVVLTLLGGLPDESRPLPSAPSSSAQRPLSGIACLDAKPVITLPQPVNSPCKPPLSQEEKQAEWRKKRVQIIVQMIEEEKRHLAELAQEMRRAGGADKAAALAEQARKRVKNLESQLTEVDSPQHLPQSPRIIGQSQSTTDVSAQATATLPPPSPTSASTSALPAVAEAVAAKATAPPVQGAAGSSDSRPAEKSPLTFVTPAQIDVIPMEEESDEEEDALLSLDTQGPFSNFAELKSRPAHLAVFLNYLISNSDPSSLLFYLVTDQYQNSSGKELRRWAYEIHSTYLVPTAPARIGNIGADVYEPIDRVLGATQLVDNDDSMRRLFVAARSRAVDDINELLGDFRHKRTLGLGSVFGEAMLQGVVPGDRPRELKIVDTLLLSHFEQLFCATTDFDQLPARAQSMAAGLATVVKAMGVKPSSGAHEKMLDKCPTFVTKDKGGMFKIKSMATKKAVQIKSHTFTLSAVYTTTICYQCGEAVWGVQPQAYFCAHCDVALHKQCTGSLDDVCAGSASGQKSVTTRRTKSGAATARARIARDVSHGSDVCGSPPKAGAVSTDHRGGSRSGSEEALLRGEDLDKTTELPTGIEKEWGCKSVSADSGYGDERLSEKPVARSQSMRTRNIPARLPPTVPQSRSAGARSYSPDLGPIPRSSSDVDVDERAIVLAMGRSAVADELASSSSSSVSHGSLADDEARKMLEKAVAADASASDSELEIDMDIPRLEDLLDWETLRLLKPKEKKRLEVINELFHTERTHVRNLKVLYRVFYTPLLVQQILQADFVKLLFMNIEEILEFHSEWNKALQRHLEEQQAQPEATNDLFGDIGAVMVEYLCGERGDKFRLAACKFCEQQQHALDFLRARTKRDARLQQFLLEAEANPLCRKLQLKDMLPVEMQRLTKYPLLIETVAKYSVEPSDEATQLRHALDGAKCILTAVNTTKKLAENHRRLDELNRRMDTSSFDKESHAVSRQFRGLDLRQYTLLHDGPLHWRLGKNKAVDLHVVLLEQLLVLLTRHSDGHRLLLKYHDTNVMRDAKWCPLLRLSSIIAKDVATDKKAFFLVSTSALGPQIYELVAQTATEKRTSLKAHVKQATVAQLSDRWFKLITEQVDLAKQKEGRGPGSLTVGDADEAAGGVDCNAAAAGGGGGDGPTERAEVVTQPRLVNPRDVSVQQPTVLEHAQPVLTPMERLRRYDSQLLGALSEKQQLLADLLPDGPQKGSVSELSRLVESLSSAEISELKQHREVREIVVSAIVQANRLLEAINEGMKLKPSSPKQLEAAPKKSADETPVLAGPEPGLPAVPCFTLTSIAAPLVKHLTAIMQRLQQTEDDLKQTRQELSHYKEMCDRQVSPVGDSGQTATAAAAADEGRTKGLVPAECLRVTQPPVVVPPRADSLEQSASDEDDEQRRRERRRQRRQRHTALTGADDPRPFASPTHPVAPPIPPP